MKGIVTCSSVGTFGRFGNSLFQYCFARAYAESIGAELHTPYWIGRDIFEGVNEPIMKEPLPDVGEQPSGEAGINLSGYFQTSQHVAFLSRNKVKEWLRPKPHYKARWREVVIHKRRGDYIQAGNYALVSDESYDNAAKKFGIDVRAAFTYSDARPVEWMYTDFFEIVSAKFIFRANSTFSWWAATLSDAKVFAPVVEDKTGWVDVDFVEGNHPRMVGLFQDLHIGE